MRVGNFFKLALIILLAWGHESFAFDAQEPSWVVYCVQNKNNGVDFEAYNNGELKVIDNFNTIHDWLEQEKIRSIEMLDLSCIRNEKISLAVLQLTNLSTIVIRFIRVHGTRKINKLLNQYGYVLDNTSDGTVFINISCDSKDRSITNFA